MERSVSLARANTARDGRSGCAQALRETTNSCDMPHGRDESLCHLDTYRYTWVPPRKRIRLSLPPHTTSTRPHRAYRILLHIVGCDFGVALRTFGVPLPEVPKSSPHSRLGFSVSPHEISVSCEQGTEMRIRINTADFRYPATFGL